MQTVTTHYPHWKILWGMMGPAGKEPRNIRTDLNPCLLVLVTVERHFVFWTFFQIWQSVRMKSIGEIPDNFGVSALGFFQAPGSHRESSPHSCAWTMTGIEPLHQSSLVQYLINLELPTLWSQFRQQSSCLSRLDPLALKTPLFFPSTLPLYFPFLSALPLTFPIFLLSWLLSFLSKMFKSVEDSRSFLSFQRKGLIQ